MELWIRSQDRLTLLQVQNDIEIIDYRGLKKTLENSVFSFMSSMEQVKSYVEKKDGWGLKANEICLGIYETKERALEVLDEIQERIIELDHKIFHYELDCVYEMPKE